MEDKKMSNTRLAKFDPVYINTDIVKYLESKLTKCGRSLLDVDYTKYKDSEVGRVHGIEMDVRSSSTYQPDRYIRIKLFYYQDDHKRYRLEIQLTTLDRFNKVVPFSEFTFKDKVLDTNRLGTPTSHGIARSVLKCYVPYALLYLKQGYKTFIKKEGKLSEYPLLEYTHFRMVALYMKHHMTSKGMSLSDFHFDYSKDDEDKPVLNGKLGKQKYKLYTRPTTGDKTNLILDIGLNYIVSLNTEKFRPNQDQSSLNRFVTSVMKILFDGQFYF